MRYTVIVSLIHFTITLMPSRLFHLGCGNSSIAPLVVSHYATCKRSTIQHGMPFHNGITGNSLYNLQWFAFAPFANCPIPFHLYYHSGVIVGCWTFSNGICRKETFQIAFSLIFTIQAFWLLPNLYRLLLCKLCYFYS